MSSQNTRYKIVTTIRFKNCKKTLYQIKAIVYNSSKYIRREGKCSFQKKWKR